ncbi:DUF3060 domain-containing protein [Massilia sp. CF038]|uniref:DUF3060 domain-containing protein n=1 Tax=Massilia sp. CF038 TaxID=1881045 RepID=UPI00091D90C2|nr:DUF3060 domain-containing protein [Massilia sp. CF038]SHH09542.1 Protein of unknown function [Massilia sp. CF038]
MNSTSHKFAVAAAAMIMMTSAYARQDDAVGEVEMTDKVISISGSGHQRTVACDGRKLELAGTDNVITATGVCSAVEILGVKNTVSVEVKPKGKLEVTGADHTVTWKSEGKITQSVAGVGHKITRVK